MEPEYEEQSLGNKVKNNLIELIEFIAVILAVLVVIRFFIAEPHKVSGSSMVPNFNDGDYIITNKLAVTISKPQRGEVVILKNPRNTNIDFIKRIVGLPGERVKIANGHVYINDQLLAEPYLSPDIQTRGEAFLTEGEEITIPEEQYLVFGDNRGGSSDSREWGPVKAELLIGQAWLRYWPPQKFNLLKINEPSI